MSSLTRESSETDAKYLHVLPDSNYESSLTYTPSQASVHTYEEPVLSESDEHTYIEPNPNITNLNQASVHSYVEANPKVTNPSEAQAVYNRDNTDHEVRALTGSDTETSHVKVIKVNSRLVLILVLVALLVVIVTVVVTYYAVKSTYNKDLPQLYNQVNVDGDQKYVVMFTQNYKASVSELIVTSQISELKLQSKNRIETLDLPTLASLTKSVNNLTTGSDVIEPKGILLMTSQNVSVYGISTYKYGTEDCCSSDGFAAIPVRFWGQEYKVITLTENLYYQKQIGVVCLHDNTGITFELNTTTNQETVSIVLNKLETYQLSRDTDLTGSSVKGNKPFSVFSGDQCGYFNGSGCSYMVENFPKMSDWGNAYIVPSFRNVTSSFVKILPSVNNVFISITAQESRVYHTNGYLQEILDSNGPTFIHGDSPFLVAAYASVDNQFFFMTLIPSLCQYSNNVVLVTPSIKSFQHSVSVIIPEEYAEGLMLNENNVSSLEKEVKKLKIENKTWLTIMFRLQDGVHRLRHPDSNVKFGIIQYGIDSKYGHDNYAYPVGLNFEKTGYKCNL